MNPIEDFYSKLFMMIVFNLSNMNSIVTKEKLLEIMKKILKPICDNEKASSKAFLNYFDNNAQYCITNGFISSIIGLSYLQTKRPFAQYIHPNIIDSISINSPTFYRDVILSSGQPNTNDICYDTLFNDISSITKYLCNKGNVNDKSRYIDGKLMTKNSPNIRIISCNFEHGLNYSVNTKLIKESTSNSIKRRSNANLNLSLLPKKLFNHHLNIIIIMISTVAILIAIVLIKVKNDSLKIKNNRNMNNFDDSFETFLA